MSDFLHGPEIIEIDDGIRPIQTVRSSVIGVVGTAPDAAPEAKAVVILGSVAGNNGVTLTSKLYGALGNAISFHARDPKANSAALSVAVTDKAIVANLATSETGAVTTTATQLVAALTANADALALVTATSTQGSSGAGVAPTSFRAGFLGGGADEPFPLNTPVMVAGNQSATAKLGTKGTLPDAAVGIFKQTGAVVVFVRVEEGADEGETLSNVVGGIGLDGKYTGAYAFLGSESKLGFCPRILIAPGFTHQRPQGAANPVVADLQGIANRLRAIVIKDGPATNDADAIDDRQNYGSKRVYIVDPRFIVMKNGAPTEVPASSYIAGLGARIDNEKGFWKSWSNEEIFGVIGTSRQIDFQLGDKNSQANLLNENEVAVIVNKDGFRLWGNRTTASDPKWAFLSRVRINDMVNESILQNHLWAVDRGITRTYFEDVAAGVNAYGRKLKAQGAIAGLLCWADKDRNPKEQIYAGQAVFRFEFSDTPPAERVTFESKLSDRFLEEIL